MVRGRTLTTFNSNTSHQKQKNAQKGQLAITLVVLMLTSLAMPSIHVENTQLESSSEARFTANGTISDSDAQTLLSNLNANNPIDVMGVVDDSNRIHLIWIQNTSTPLLQYALIQISPTIDTVLISNTQVGGNSSTSLSAPSMVIDSTGRAHIVWEVTNTEILYTILDPSADDLDGSAGDIANMTVTSYTIASGSGTRSDPDIAVDSYDAVHIVWVDSYDPQGAFFNSPLVYYCMLFESSNNGFEVLINNTLVTPALGHRGNPAISIGANNTAVIVWEDTRGSMVEYVGLLDSSGSMTTEWTDMCAIFYGGTLTTGENFAGIKPMIESANITVLETLYTLSGNMFEANSQTNCANAVSIGDDGSNGPRSTALGINSTDNSGGIRPLTEVVYNGSSLSLPLDNSYNSEMWGPGSTWACLSWRDSSGSMPGNPATAADHVWNPNATKLVIPVSDEGPFGGSPSLEADDYQSINESHQACLEAGIIPVPVAGTLDYGPSTIWHNNTHVRHHMMDLAHCPDTSLIGIQARNCDGTSVQSTDAGGELFYYPTEELADLHGDFENGALTATWNTNGAVGWAVQNNTVIDGLYSAESGNISNNQHSSIRYQGALNDGTMSFDWSVSSEPNYDYLLFCVDNPTCSPSSFTAAWSGESNGTYSAAVQPGYHTYTWKYYKDGSVSLGNDSAWIDNVQLPISSYTDEMNQMVDSIINLTTGSGATNTFLTVLNPYSILSNPRSTWSTGDSAHSIDSETGQYLEDLGPDVDWYWREDGSGWDTVGHFVLVNDTRLTKGHTWALNPDVNVDDDGNIHVVWIDGREQFPSKSGPSQLHYMQIDPTRGGVLDGEAYGLNLDETVVVRDTAIQQSNLIWGANPRVDFDRDDSIHITWFETGAKWDADIVELRWTRIQSPVMNGFEEIPLNRYLTQAYSIVNTRTISSSSDNLMGIYGSEFSASAQPIVKFDWPERTIAWTANDCNNLDSQFNKWDVCLWSEDLFDMSLELAPGESGDVTMQPDSYKVVDLNLQGISVPGGDDVVTISTESIPDYWNIDVGFDSAALPSTTLIEGETKDVVLRIRSPSLHLANEDQSFDITLIVQSTTDEYANTFESIHINLVNNNDWNDDDQDGITDENDQCHFGESNWDSNTMTDFDGDGCRDSSEDFDDDNDGVLDEFDECPLGVSNSALNDADSDGCDDLIEDTDNDGDGVPNHVDNCPNGAQYWASFSTDYDGDGCRDPDEDNNDDNDPFLDVVDECPTGVIGWTDVTFDHDSDGCHDLEEDTDDDSDGVLDTEDMCPIGLLDWISDESTDYDGDGCNDMMEDNDLDNDGVEDLLDLCVTGESGWQSGIITDWDSDGCHDLKEDDDDDGDGYLDIEDLCPRSPTSVFSDNDLDGCDDWSEDRDLDNDGIETSEDNCENNPISVGWVSSLSSDRDQDGCKDSTEDNDDDGDNILDSEDACPMSIRVTLDHDSDGCMDEFDLDDDNDGILDNHDHCIHGAIGWTSSKETDIDSDGCLDAVEDKSLPRGIVETIQNSPILITIMASVMVLILIGGSIQARRRFQNSESVESRNWDQTSSLEDSKVGVWGVKTKPIEVPNKTTDSIEEHVQNLVESGYSPEVARAIVASESALRGTSGE